MALLNLLLLSAILHPAFAAPLFIPDAIPSWVPERFKPSLQDIIDFLNPRHTPSVNQAFISCLVVIVLSAFLAGPAVISYPKNATWLQMIHFRMSFVLYGFISPDFYMTRAWKEVAAEGALASIYNKLFLKDAPRKDKWRSVHGAFVAKRGFVLWRDNKPAKPLSFKELVKMIKEKKIEPPVLSQKEIFARSKRAPYRYLSFVLYFPVYWFVHKFTSTLPTLVILAATHGFFCWYGFVWKFCTIISVVEPIVIIAKPDEKGLEPLIPVEDTTDLPEKVHDEEFYSEKSEKSSDVESATEAASPEGTQDIPRTSVVTLLKVLLTLVLVPVLLAAAALGWVYGQLCFIFRASTVSLRDQWDVISKPFNALTIASYIIGTLVSCMIWCFFFICGRYSHIFPTTIEWQIWRASSLFLLLQPVILLLAPRRLRTKIHERIQTGFFFVYSLIYSAARFSLIFLAFYAARKAF